MRPSAVVCTEGETTWSCQTQGSCKWYDTFGDDELGRVVCAQELPSPSHSINHCARSHISHDTLTCGVPCSHSTAPLHTTTSNATITISNTTPPQPTTTSQGALRCTASQGRQGPSRPPRPTFPTPWLPDNNNIRSASQCSTSIHTGWTSNINIRRAWWACNHTSTSRSLHTCCVVIVRSHHAICSNTQPTCARSIDNTG